MVEDPKRSIRIQGARMHNLKNVSCEIPHRRFTVITGPSGSGKSSLAFDTLYAEGQRRFVESMSAYARQFLERIEKPDVEQIQHILPAIALEQKNQVKNARSTVGTATEVYDFMRVLYASVGETVCDECDHPVERATPKSIENELLAKPDGTKAIISVPVFLSQWSEASLITKGYFRIVEANGEIRELDPRQPLEPSVHMLDVVIDRLILSPDKSAKRLRESIRKAMDLNAQEIHVHILEDAGVTTRSFHTEFLCSHCQKPFTEPFPNLFSFNNPLGACKSCEGFGKIIGLDFDKVIPSRKKSLREGAIHPFTTPSNQEMQDDLLREGKRNKIRLDVPYEELNDAEKEFVIGGKGSYSGVYAFFNWLETKKYKVHVRVMLAKYRGYYTCPDCHGSRLKRDALQVRVGDKSIHDLCTLPIAQLHDFFNALTFPPEKEPVVNRLMKEIQGRLSYLVEIGLEYLTLARQSRTLSGGEAQRINLSAALGSALTDTLYVLDEPTVGLHARDTQRLLRVLQALRNMGNTVVVVEHDPEIIMGADRVIDLGPTGGQEGGHIVYEGPVSEFLDVTYSRTAQYIKNPPAVEAKPLTIKKTNPWVRVLGASGNNLKNIDVGIPCNRFVCLSGVSGSGKSSLIKQTLYANYQHEKGSELALEALPCVAMEGLEPFEDVILVDQSPPGRSVRSNPVTYVKAYDEIRKLFAATRQAQALGITAGHFSFNTAGGRCETCEGLGTITIDMQFMADVTVTCHECQGRRFSPAVLSIEFNGKTIKDVLDLTVEEALHFFDRHNRVIKKLLPLQAIGLEYLHLGQSTSTLSGGEAQRLKLATYLSASGHTGKPYLFLFDEPTTGLHLTDIERLINVFRRLLVEGHSLVVIEHNIELLAHADYLIDLGPEGGDGGGRILVEGPPSKVAQCAESYTGQFLKERLGTLMEQKV